MNKKIISSPNNLFSFFIVVLFLFSSLGFSLSTAYAQDTPDVDPMADLDKYFNLTPSLSADGLTLINGIPPLVMVVDPDPALKNLKFPQDPEVVAAINDPSLATATFQITYVAAGGEDPWHASCQAFPEAAKTAFNAAAAIWANTLKSSVPIKISACWSNLGSPTTLGYSGGAYAYRDFSGAPKAGTWYEESLANALHGSDLNASSYDDYITYNSGFSWYYGTDGNPPAGTFDLVTVAAHEIAHGLNFSGSAQYSGGNGAWGSSGYPYIYDTFMEDSSGTKLTAYSTPSTALGTLLTSGSLWFNAPNANAANGGSRVKMYAPGTWSSGSSYSHLDYDTFKGTANSMMVYAVSDGASQHNPGLITKGIMKDMGWPMGGVVVVIPTPQAPSGTITDTTPTYKWSKITGANQYRFRVYKGTSTTPLYTKTITSPTCTTTSCTNTPTNILALASYKWQVQAMVGGVWKAWSGNKAFTVAAPIAGFNSQFNGTMSGWAKKAGAAWNVNTAAMYSSGNGGWNSVYRNTSQYSNFDYSARVKRTGGTYYDGYSTWYPASYITVRTGTSVKTTSENKLYPSYNFGITNLGSYYIFKADSSGNTSTLQTWTSSSKIVKNGWNTLRVVANGSTMKFYINGTLVKTITDSMRAKGYVGLEFYKFSSGTATKFEVDWAKLTVLTTAYKNEDVVSPEQEALNIAAMENGTSGTPEGIVE